MMGTANIFRDELYHSNFESQDITELRRLNNKVNNVRYRNDLAQLFVKGGANILDSVYVVFWDSGQYFNKIKVRALLPHAFNKHHRPTYSKWLRNIISHYHKQEDADKLKEVNLTKSEITANDDNQAFKCQYMVWCPFFNKETGQLDAGMMFFRTKKLSAKERIMLDDLIDGYARHWIDSKFESYIANLEHQPDKRFKIALSCSILFIILSAIYLTLL